MTEKDFKKVTRLAKINEFLLIRTQANKRKSFLIQKLSLKLCDTIASFTWYTKNDREYKKIIQAAYNGKMQAWGHIYKKEVTKA